MGQRWIVLVKVLLSGVLGRWLLRLYVFIVYTFISMFRYQCVLTGSLIADPSHYTSLHPLFRDAYSRWVCKRTSKSYCRDWPWDLEMYSASSATFTFKFLNFWKVSTPEQGPFWWTEYITRTWSLTLWVPPKVLSSRVRFLWWKHSSRLQLLNVSRIILIQVFDPSYLKPGRKASLCMQPTPHFPGVHDSFSAAVDVWLPR